MTINEKDLKVIPPRCPHGKRFGVDWSYKACRGCRHWYICGLAATGRGDAEDVNEETEIESREDVG